MLPLPHLITAGAPVDHGGSGGEKQGDKAGADDPSSPPSLSEGC